MDSCTVYISLHVGNSICEKTAFCRVRHGYYKVGIIEWTQTIMSGAIVKMCAE